MRRSLHSDDPPVISRPIPRPGALYIRRWPVLWLFLTLESSYCGLLSLERAYRITFNVLRSEVDSKSQRSMTTLSVPFLGAPVGREGKGSHGRRLDCSDYMWTRPTALPEHDVSQPCAESVAPNTARVDAVFGRWRMTERICL